MNRDVCLIPCYNRPEFLEICLEQIQKAKGADKLLYLFQVDHGYDKRIEKIIQHFPLDHGTKFQTERVEKSNKLSRNISDGYKWALTFEPDYIFMIEEDVMIADDFFEWHYKVQKEGSFFCSIASRNNNLNRFIEFDKDPTKFYTSHCTYQSLGVCFRKLILKDLILPDFNEEFFINKKNYCIHEFPNSLLGDKWYEQAGLIRRIQEIGHLPIAYPHLPRAFHAGFYGKNRIGGIQGTPETKAARLKDIIFDTDRMRSHSMNELYYQDSKPIHLKIPKYGKLKFTEHYANEFETA